MLQKIVSGKRLALKSTGVSEAESDLFQGWLGSRFKKEVFRFLQYAQSHAAHWTQKYDQEVHEEHPNASVMNFTK